MKLLRLNIALVVLVFCCSTRAAPVTDDNDDLREMIQSLQVLFCLTCALHVCLLKIWNQHLSLFSCHRGKLQNFEKQKTTDRWLVSHKMHPHSCLQKGHENFYRTQSCQKAMVVLLNIYIIGYFFLNVSSRHFVSCHYQCARIQYNWWGNNCLGFRPD